MRIVFNGIFNRHVCDSNILGKNDCFNSYGFVKNVISTQNFRCTLESYATFTIIGELASSNLLMISFEVFVCVIHVVLNG